MSGEHAGAGPTAAATELTLYCDGASRGNPGPAGAGAILFDAGGRVVARDREFLGVQTNNVAEYRGLLLGLRRALELGARHVRVRADSELMVRQVRGEYRVKNERLRSLHREARALLAKFAGGYRIEHVRREMNGDADQLSNEAIDLR